MSLIGNPVKFGDGPAAVIPPFSNFTGKGNPFGHCVPLFSTEWEGRYLGGKVRRPAWAEAEAFEDMRCQMILRIKRDIPGSIYFGPVFFIKCSTLAF